jgi:hypothetical protein
MLYNSAESSTLHFLMIGHIALFFKPAKVRKKCVFYNVIKFAWNL